MQQRLLGWNAKQLFQFRGKVAGRSLIDKGFSCVQQGPVARKTNRVKGPQAVFIEVGDFRERIELAAVGVAGVIGEILELAKDCDIRFRTQHLLELPTTGESFPSQERTAKTPRKSYAADN